MNKVLVDTNVLVSFLTDRDALQQQQTADLFAASERGDVALVLPQVILAELIYVLANLYRVAVAEVAATVDELLALPGVVTVDEISWPVVREFWPKEIQGFTDAVIAAVAKVGRYEIVATFDLKLRRALRRHHLRSYW